MLAYAGHAVVMENSPAELLDIAASRGWMVAGGNENDGAAQAILRMLEGTGPVPDPAAALAD
jgi:hydroxymethylpyrimidine pyrophosphatase-like HAD family hydrolase